MRRARDVLAAAALVLALSVPAAAHAVTLRPGDLIASFNDPPDSIARISPRTGDVDVIATGDHLKEPWQVAITPRGRILVADQNDHAVLSIDPRDGAQSVVSTEPGFQPVGIALTASGRLIVSDFPADSIIAINPGSGAQSPISSDGSLTAPAGLAVAPSGRIFVADEGVNPGVYAINPRTGAQTPVATAGLSDPYSVALAPNGRVLFVDYGLPEPGATIFSVRPRGGPLRTISTGQLFGDPLGLARSFNGPLFVAEQDEPTVGSIIRVNPRNGAQRTVVRAESAGLSTPAAIAVVPPRCFGRFATIVGGPRADALKGTTFADVIAGVGGGDRIRGRGGNDRICGGKGPDRLIGGRGRDRLLGGSGLDSTDQ